LPRPEHGAFMLTSRNIHGLLALVKPPAAHHTLLLALAVMPASTDKQSTQLAYMLNSTAAGNTVQVQAPQRVYSKRLHTQKPQQQPQPTHQNTTALPRTGNTLIPTPRTPTDTFGDSRQPPPPKLLPLPPP
jgi:hypothetical protein